MKYLSDAEWIERMYPPCVTDRKLSDAEAAEATRLSCSIALTVRNTERLVAEFHRRPVTFAELALLAMDHDATWAGWLAPLRNGISAVATARKQHARLVALLGADATVLDHGWGAGREQMSMPAIDQHLCGAEAMVAPLAALDRALKAPARRTA